MGAMISGKFAGVVFCGAALSLLLGTYSLNGQSNEGDPEIVTRTWRVGASIQGGAKPVTNLIVTFPVPTDWPEQHVNVYKENIPPEARSADFRDSDGIRQMVARIPRVMERTKVDINVVLDITVSAVPLP